jgi:hypothetical protein
MRAQSNDGLQDTAACGFGTMEAVRGHLLLANCLEELPPAGRNESGIPLRWNALDPGFHGIPRGPAHTDREADDAGVA